MSTDRQDPTASIAANRAERFSRGRLVRVTGLCAVAALALVAADAFASVEAASDVLANARPVAALTAPAPLQVAGDPGAAGAAKRPPEPIRGSSAALHGGSSADRYGGSSVDKRGIAQREAKQSPQERAAERASQQADVEAARRHQADVNGGQAFPAK
ncbi:MAG: hypothetical protein HY899_10235 [Deltaproteobacteria bacterium]|nr:hypothetical protein [Deltaproteobacteria bacterium]